MTARKTEQQMLATTGGERDADGKRGSHHETRVTRHGFGVNRRETS
jgi:hypothetical protein